MTLKQRDTFAADLRHRREALIQRLHLLRRQVAIPAEVGGDPVDRALDAINRGTDLLLMEMDYRELDRLTVAEQRLQDRRFGTCKSCGGDINPRRLAVVPESVFCVRCALEIEKHRTH